MKCIARAALAALSITVSTAPALHAEEAQLRAGVFIPVKTNLTRQAFDAFVEAVNADGEGLVKIGPVVSNEAVPARDMPAALRSGVLDIIAVPPSYFSSFVPGSEGLSAARVPPSVQRENGAWDMLNEALTERAGVRLLAQYGAGTSFHVFTTFEVAQSSDLIDKRLGSSNTWKSFFEGAGIQAINTPVNDYYTAVERGVIQGFANTNATLPALGLDDVVNYRIDPGFYSAVIAVAINERTWQGLTPEQQAYLNEKALYLENQISDQFAEKDEAIGQAMIDAGKLEVMTLTGADAEHYLDTAYGSTWQVIESRAPEFGAKLHALLSAQ